MDANYNRRGFLRAASALGLGAAAGLDGLGAITPARADDLVVGPDAVRFRPDIEPVVRWIEETPRERALDVAIAKLKEGLSYRDLMAGLFLAGVRNIKPRPVGFKFHAVMVINSAHLIAQSAAEGDRLLPLFWALDNFKASQLQDVKEGDWTLNKVDESHLPSPTQAKAAFVKAMDAWDADAADAATAAFCRSAGAGEVMEAFWRYGLRDQRNIGHKAIFTAQCWRTLQAIGWPNAEPVLRSLAFGILDLQRDKTPAPVGPYEANLENARKIREGWTIGKCDPGASTTLLETIRHASPEEASSQVVEQLNAGISPESLWDGVTLAASELMLRKPGAIGPLHAMTSANALHYAFGASGDDTTRKLALLQAAGWLPMFRGDAKSDVSIDAIEPAAPEGSGEGALIDVFATAHDDRTRAAHKAMGYLRNGGSPDDFFAVARRMILRKAADSHDYKYGAAAWEEYHLASDPKWQAPLVATVLTKLPDAKQPDSPMMEKARGAVSRVLGS